MQTSMSGAAARLVRMKALQRTEDDGCYWYPLRPALRWPARIAGVLLTLGLLAEWATTGHLRWQGLFIPLWFISLSFDTPERRPKITSYYLGMAVILGVPILLFAIYSVLGAFGDLCSEQPIAQSKSLQSGCPEPRSLVSAWPAGPGAVDSLSPVQS